MDGTHKHNLTGHTRGIASLQLRDGIAVSGSNDRTIRVWRIESGECLHILNGHSALVRSLCYDGRQIISGGYDG